MSVKDVESADVKSKDLGPSGTPPPEYAQSQSDVDDAYKFLADNVGVAAVEAIDMKKLRRKVDLHIVYLMGMAYTLQFLDKVCLNYGAVMGLIPDLGLVGDQFSNIATFLFVGLFIFEIPNIWFLQKFDSAKWLGFCVTAWGIATACGAAATSYQTLLVSRVFLGVFEATIAPSLLLISSQWYTKSEQAPRFSFWYCGLGAGQILGGLVSFAFQHISGGSLAGWRVMFIVLGCITLVVGLSIFFFLPGTPMKAKWLTDAEKVALLKHVSVNQTGIHNNKFKPKQILEALMDVQLWLLLMCIVLLSVSSGVITSYSATLIRSLGYTSKETALLNMPSGVVSIFFTLFVGLGIRNHSHRWAWCIACICPAILGGALMSFLPTSNKAGILAGLYLVNAVVAPLAIYYQYAAANFGGATKRAFAAAVVSGSFSIGNIIGPQTFRAEDAPEYRQAKRILLGTQAACAFTTFLLFLYYWWANKQRSANAKKSTEEEYMDPEVWASLTDKENPRFRYSY